MRSGLRGLLIASVAIARASAQVANNASIDHSAQSNRRNWLFDHRRLAKTKWGTFQVLETVPHDTSAFTEGLVLVPQSPTGSPYKLYEGTGLYGKSQVRQVDLQTGKVLKSTALERKYFGEGIAYYNISGQGRIVQLTWKENTAFIYDSETLTRLSSFAFRTKKNEGWGITYRPSTSTFVVSDGSSFLHSWNQTNWNETKRVRVTMNRFGRSFPVHDLNELEWDPSSDTILANVWRRNWLLRIDPDTGFVKVFYDLRFLFLNRPVGTDVLNGIAMVPNTTDEVWVTGKFWPSMFRIRLIDK